MSKFLSKPPYLPNTFVLLINLCHFVIVEKGIFFFWLVSVNIQWEYLWLTIFCKREVHY